MAHRAAYSTADGPANELDCDIVARQGARHFRDNMSLEIFY